MPSSAPLSCLIYENRHTVSDVLASIYWCSSYNSIILMTLGSPGVN